MADDLARRAHAILRKVIEIEEVDRSSFVTANCAGEPELRARVMSLLAAIEKSRGFLENPALGADQQGSCAEPDRQVEWVGPYKIVRAIGVGGMATVYEAVQDRPRRRVALKVMRRGLEHTNALHRFEFETEVLARLKHPGIAQIYEAGAHTDSNGVSVPFFAMEYIPNAQPITEYADAHGLDLHARLRMLASACDAVQHGHQNGVIHRDLKPGNILVDPSGNPKVIDFGIARSSDPAQAWITRQTDLGQLVGTLNYMSPEQCSAGAVDVDVRTDVYSLGVILYESICGRLPHDFRSTPLPEAVRVVHQDRPVRPGAIDPALCGDIEAIVMMAIEKEPERRYPSVAALATDIRRYLRHEAIEARPPTLLTQCRLFARRNRGLTVALLAALFAITTAAVVSTAFAMRAVQESNRRAAAEIKAIEERDLARRSAYIANIAGAFGALQTGEMKQVRTRLAQASEEYRGWEWGFVSGLAERNERVIDAHSDMVFSIDISPDGERFVTGSRDGSIRIWSVSTGEMLLENRLEDLTAVHSVGFSPSSDRIVVGADSGSVSVWDLDGPSAFRRIGEHAQRVRTVSFLRDRTIISASDDGVARVWDSETGEQIGSIGDQPGGVMGAACSKDGRTLVTWGRDGIVVVRDSATFHAMHRMQFDGVIEAGVLSEDGAVFVAGGEGGRATVWDTRTGDPITDISVPLSTSTFFSFALSPDGSLLAAGLASRGVGLWALPAGTITGVLRGHADGVSGVEFLPDSATILSASWDRTVRYWRPYGEPRQAAIFSLRGHQGHILTTAFSPDGQLIASAGRDGTIIIWAPALGRRLATLRADGSDIYRVAFSPDGAWLASGSADGVVRLWDARTGELVRTLKGHTGPVWSVVFDPAGQRVLSASQDKTMRVWNVESGELERVMSGHAERVTDAAFSPDGRTIASASRDQSVRLWDASTGRPLHVLRGHASDVFAVAFSGDGRRLYSGSRDQTVRVWDTKTGECLNTLGGHGQFVTSLSLASDGSRLAAGSWFGEILVWSTATDDLVTSFKGHDTAIRTVSFSPDGRWLVSGSIDHSMRIYDSAAPAERQRHYATALEHWDSAGVEADRLIETYGSALEALRAVRNETAENTVWIRKQLFERAYGVQAPESSGD
jgi:WD40 repeat protein/tRNA A-37 threonylcarbamoyl transferase component Bud32